MNAGLLVPGEFWAEPCSECFQRTFLFLSLSFLAEVMRFAQGKWSLGNAFIFSARSWDSRSYTLCVSILQFPELSSRGVRPAPGPWCFPGQLSFQDETCHFQETEPFQGCDLQSLFSRGIWAPCSSVTCVDLARIQIFSVHLMVFFVVRNSSLGL